MARGLQNTDNVNAPTTDFPYGRVRDNDGTGNGTPANEKTLGDFHQFFARLLDQASSVPNGLPDSAYYGFQYFEALLKKFVSNDQPNSVRWIRKKIDLTDWNMSTTVSKTFSHGIADYTKIISVRAIIVSDTGIRRPLDAFVNGSIQGGCGQISASAVSLVRLSAGEFDDADYSGTGARGTLMIDYIA